MGRRTIHRTYDQWKLASPDDELDGREPEPERDPDAEYDQWRDEQMCCEECDYQDDEELRWQTETGK